MKIVDQKDYINRLEGFLKEVEEKIDNTISFSMDSNSYGYLGSLGGQKTMLNREIEYLKTHVINSNIN